MTQVMISPSLETNRPTTAAPARPPRPPMKAYSHWVSIPTMASIQERMKVSEKQP